jgi:hypothetical protein
MAVKKKKARAKKAAPIDHAAGHKQALQDVKAAGWKVASHSPPTAKGGGLIRAKHPACKHPNESVDIFTGVRGESVGIIPKADHTKKRRYRGSMYSPKAVKPLLTKLGKIHKQQGTIMKRSEEASLTKRKDELARKIETANGFAFQHGPHTEHKYAASITGAAGSKLAGKLKAAAGAHGAHYSEQKGGHVLIGGKSKKAVFKVLQATQGNQEVSTVLFDESLSPLAKRKEELAKKIETAAPKKRRKRPGPMGINYGKNEKDSLKEDTKFILTEEDLGWMTGGNNSGFIYDIFEGPKAKAVSRAKALSKKHGKPWQHGFYKEKIPRKYANMPPRKRQKMMAEDEAKKSGKK